MGKHIIFYKSEDTPGKKDATGAFIPESRALADLLIKRFEGVMRLAAENRVGVWNLIGDIDSISFFCHGWPTGIELFERGKTGASLMARTIREKKTSCLNLFACSTASQKVEKNFCLMIAEALKAQGCSRPVQIMGHETPGHTSWNPYVRFYWYLPATDGKRARIETERAVDPKRDGRDEWKAFVKRMKEDQEYRLMLPYIFDEERKNQDV